MNDNHAQYIQDQYETGAAQVKRASSRQERMAKIIQSLLDQAELAAKRNDETARDEALAKASALQLKFAIDDALLSRVGDDSADAIEHMDFCQESNTPLIKVKRELINGLAQLNRGKAVLCGQWQPKIKGGGMKYNRRAYVRVYAHASDLRFISQMYTSLVLQLQTMMARDEDYDRRYRGTPTGGWGKWRVSYGYGWVGRVYARLQEAKQRNEHAAERETAGTALVLRDRTQLVDSHVHNLHSKLRQSSYRRDDNSNDGRARGREAAELADLGGAKVAASNTRALEA